MRANSRTRAGPLHFGCGYEDQQPLGAVTIIENSGCVNVPQLILKSGTVASNRRFTACISLIIALMGSQQ